MTTGAVPPGHQQNPRNRHRPTDEDAQRRRGRPRRGGLNHRCEHGNRHGPLRSGSTSARPRSTATYAKHAGGWAHPWSRGHPAPQPAALEPSHDRGINGIPIAPALLQQLDEVARGGRTRSGRAASQSPRAALNHLRRPDSAKSPHRARRTPCTPSRAGLRHPPPHQTRGLSPLPPSYAATRTYA